MQHFAPPSQKKLHQPQHAPQAHGLGVLSSIDWSHNHNTDEDYCYKIPFFGRPIHKTEYASLHTENLIHNTNLGKEWLISTGRWVKRALKPIVHLMYRAVGLLKCRLHTIRLASVLASFESYRSKPMQPRILGSRSQLHPSNAKRWKRETKHQKPHQKDVAWSYAYLD